MSGVARLNSEQRDAWRRDAIAYADETRHPSGYDPSERILALLDEIEARDRAAYRNSR